MPGKLGVEQKEAAVHITWHNIEKGRGYFGDFCVPITNSSRNYRNSWLKKKQTLSIVHLEAEK